MTSPPRRGPGRPVDDGADRRQTILDAARHHFAENGYAAASVRAIARASDVDPSLVHHYFGNKEQLFVAAMELPYDPADRLSAVLAGDLEGLAERLARMFLSMWSDPDFRTPMLGLVRSAFSSEQGAALLREFIGSALLARVGQATGVDPLRMEVAAAQMVGIVMMRYVVRMEPVASATDDELVSLVAPTIHRYLDL